MIKHHPSIASELARFRRRKRKPLKLAPSSDYRLRREREHFEAEAAANIALHDPPANPTPEDILIARDDRAIIDAALLKLPARTERVLRLYHGLDGEPHTLQQIGEMLGTARERPRQIMATAYRQLRHPSRRLEPLRGKYTDRWHESATRWWLPPWSKPALIELIPWSNPIVVELARWSEPQQWHAPQVAHVPAAPPPHNDRGAPFGLPRERVPEYARVLADMLILYGGHRHG